MPTTSSEQLTFWRLGDLTGTLVKTWSDLGMVPTSQLGFDIPSLKTNYIEIPGRSSQLDLTNSLTPWNYYDNISGSFEFYMIDDRRFGGNTTQTQGKLRNMTNREKIVYLNRFFNGYRMRCWFGDTTYGQCREGRFWVSSKDFGEDISTITISYNVEPYSFFKDGLGDKYSQANTDTIPVASLAPNQELDITSSITTKFKDFYSTDVPVTPEYLYTTEINADNIVIKYGVRRYYGSQQYDEETISGLNDITLIVDHIEGYNSYFKIPDDMYLYGDAGRNSETQYDHITPVWKIKNISNSSLQQDTTIRIAMSAIKNAQL